MRGVPLPGRTVAAVDGRLDAERRDEDAGLSAARPRSFTNAAVVGLAARGIGAGGELRVRLVDHQRVLHESSRFLCVVECRAVARRAAGERAID